jgi:hypothetical protein
VAGVSTPQIVITKHCFVTPAQAGVHLLTCPNVESHQMDSRLRGNDESNFGVVRIRDSHPGESRDPRVESRVPWVPAFAGMTSGGEQG